MASIALGHKISSSISSSSHTTKKVQIPRISDHQAIMFDTLSRTSVSTDPLPTSVMSRFNRSSEDSTERSWVPDRHFGPRPPSIVVHARRTPGGTERGLTGNAEVVGSHFQRRESRRLRTRSAIPRAVSPPRQHDSSRIHNQARSSTTRWILARHSLNRHVEDVPAGEITRPNLDWLSTMRESATPDAENWAFEDNENGLSPFPYVPQLGAHRPPPRSWTPPANTADCVEDREPPSSRDVLAFERGRRECLERHGQHPPDGYRPMDSRHPFSQAPTARSSTTPLRGPQSPRRATTAEPDEPQSVPTPPTSSELARYRWQYAHTDYGVPVEMYGRLHVGDPEIGHSISRGAAQPTLMPPQGAGSSHQRHEQPPGTVRAFSVAERRRLREGRTSPVFGLVEHVEYADAAQPTPTPSQGAGSSHQRYEPPPGTVTASVVSEERRRREGRTSPVYALVEHIEYAEDGCWR